MVDDRKTAMFFQAESKYCFFFKWKITIYVYFDPSV